MKPRVFKAKVFKESQGWNPVYLFIILHDVFHEFLQIRSNFKSQTENARHHGFKSTGRIKTPPWGHHFFFSLFPLKTIFLDMQSQVSHFFFSFQIFLTYSPSQPQRTHIFVRLIKLQLISLFFPAVIKIKLYITIGQQN